MSRVQLKESSREVSLPEQRRFSRLPERTTRRGCRPALLAAAALAFAALAGPLTRASTWPARDGSARRIVSQQNGTLTVHEGDRVRVSMELGDVRVRTQSSGSVGYRLVIEAPAGSNWGASQAPRFQLSARSGSDGAVIVGRAVSERSSERYWVTLELDVPRATPLEISTQGGAIDVDDIDGRLVCDTAGGKIRTGRVGSSARLHTAGGDVFVQEVSGDLMASTGGGNIVAGPVRGSASLRTGGGHIRAVRVDGEAHMETGGGNIFLDRAGANLVATTGGGRIMVGEASGELQARTGGGGIRVWRLAGPARIETGAGSIFLAGVTSPVRATTGSGGITALFSPVVAVAPVPPTPKAPGAPRGPEVPRAQPSGTLAELQCTGGDLVVFLPRNASLNLDAAIEGGDNYRMMIDPAFPVSLKSDELSHGGSLRAEGVMGSGGPLLRLRAVSGNILLRPAEGPEVLSVPILPAMPAAAIPPVPPIPPRPGEDIDAAIAHLEISITQMQSQLESRQEALESYASAQEVQAMRMARRSMQQERRLESRANRSTGGDSDSGEVEYDWSPDQLSQMEGLREQFTAWLTDRVIIPADQMRPRLVRRVDPAYPEQARKLGLEGPVRLRVAIARDGSIEDVKALSGHPLLAEAAADAVRQWRYRPTVLNGKQVPVLTVITVTFHHQ